MSTRQHPNRVTRLFAQLAPESYRDAMLGDLAEEHALRSSGGAPQAATRWFAFQLVASVVPLLRAAFARAAWVGTVATCIGAYLAGAALCFGIDRLCLALLGPGPRWFPAAIIVLANVALVAYCAARIRPRAALLLAGVIFVDYALRLLGEPAAPTWFLLTILILGPTLAAVSERLAATTAA